MQRRTPLLAAAAGTILVLSMAGCSGTAASSGTDASAHVVDVRPGDHQLPAPTKPLSSITWYGSYRSPYTLDPIRIADDPEDMVLPNVCEPVLTMDSAHRLQPGIASSWTQVSGTELVLDIRSARFSDGTPVTADDVVYSLDRVMDPANGSPFAEAYTTVSAIRATSPSQVTITFKVPDYLFVDALATAGAGVVEKADVESAGADFGTPKALPVCAGAYKFDSWDGATKLVMSANPYYWDTAAEPKVKKVTFLYPTEPSAVSNAIVGGQLTGAFGLPEDIVSTVAASGKGTVYKGSLGSSPQNIDLIVSDLHKGALANVKVRQALSLVLDRKAIAQKVFYGLADPLYEIVGPGMWPSDTASLYRKAYAKATIGMDVARAKKLVDESGEKGATITIGYLPQQTTFTKIATLWQQSAEQLGLHMKIVAIPADQYGQLFVDKSARAAYDGFLTKNYIEYPSPTTMDASYGTPTGFQDYGGYSNPRVTALLEEARGTASPTRRAELTIQAESILSRELPWIPIVQPRTTVYLARGLTGAPLVFSYLTSPWASGIGGK